jgi:hypothetical protein
MRRLSRHDIPYFLARRRRRPPTPEPPKPKLGTRQFLEICGFIVAVAAALLAYFELCTVRAERLTPYRAVIFTAQFESYRELVRLRDRIQAVVRAEEPPYSIREITANRSPAEIARSEQARLTAICLMYDTGLSENEQGMKPDIANLSIALVTAQAIWPRGVQEELSSTQHYTELVREALGNIELRIQIREDWNLDYCRTHRGRLRNSLMRLQGALDNTLTAMRRSLQFDQVSTVPRN